MPEFLRRYPKVDVRLRLEDHYMGLIDDRIDLALRITDRPAPGLIGRPLMTIEHLLCATPRYLVQQGTPRAPRELAEHSCIYLGETPSDARWRFCRKKPWRSMWGPLRSICQPNCGYLSIIWWRASASTPR